ncbi:maltoporin [Chitinimonas sp.]|uniref:maltoporin n=1 Tax=Chitinimonas sp. TaxID=1934313 RepID=UPI0035AF6375
MTRKTKLFAAVVAALSAQAWAVPVDFHGYLRSGSGSGSEGGNVACFQINAPAFGGDVGRSGRLGNECDTYGELAFDAGLGETMGIGFKLHTMVAFGSQQIQDYEQSVPAWRQAWIEATNVGSGALANATMWAGKRFYKRHDVHIADFFWSADTGPGAGIENVDLGMGGAKFSYALMRNGSASFGNTGGNSNQDLLRATTIDNPGKAISNHDFRIEGIDVGMGSIDLGANFVLKNNGDTVTDIKDASGKVVGQSRKTIGGKGGVGLTVAHNYSNPFDLGGFNSFVFQYANDGANLDGTGKWWADENVKYRGWRVIEHLVFEPKGSDWNGAVFFGYGKERLYNESNGKLNWGDRKDSSTTTLVVRPVYHFNEAYSVAFEAGTTRVKPGTGDSYYLNKFTIAPQLSAGKGFWARPVLRAYYTLANWNKAAGNPAATGRDLGVELPQYRGKTNGSSYGVQMEAWW